MLEDAGGSAIPDLQALHEDALRKLYETDANSPVANLAFLQRLLTAGDWAGVLQLWRARAARTSASADRMAVAQHLNFCTGALQMRRLIMPEA